MIDVGFFPNTRFNYYWSSSPSAGSSDDAFGVSFSGGNVYRGSRNIDLSVRLVRSEP